MWLLLVSDGMAEGNTSQQEGYMDELHKSFSEKVLEWSDMVDVTLSEWLGGEENSTEPGRAKSEEEKLLKERTSTDAFFQSDKYLGETDDTYLRVRFDTQFQNREENEFNVRVSAHLPLSRSKKRFNLFVEDVNKDNAKNVLEDTDEKNAAPRLGINYFAPEAYGVRSKYSIGLVGIHPYVRARYNILFETGEWIIEPVQSFEYSTKYQFEEETDLYFDTQPNDVSLFRLQLYRKTETRTDGMDYAFIFSYFYTGSRETGWRVSQTFWGNTQYSYSVDDGTEPPVMSEPYGGISDYRTELSWRRNVWRKWFFYELMPSVNFHRRHDYRPNYAFRFYLDFYFGTYRW
ncbi:hypothetical protein HCR_16520 [Hydrogenimonas cancrithermarum]|uniref:Uncharacterized protein n=2 Tax=Hydrogenimonas cancrithermarum TaxID=2993563 RepID=A0ABM8FLU3_9BACT|nr:hypothetical protein HCR_16520 [Hydrogenimonas cancrithermarum]